MKPNHEEVIEHLLKKTNAYHGEPEERREMAGNGQILYDLIYILRKKNIITAKDFEKLCDPWMED